MQLCWSNKLIVSAVTTVSAAKHVHSSANIGFFLFFRLFFLGFFSSSSAATTTAAAVQRKIKLRE